MNLYIITNSSFPYGNANSNYIRYFAKCLSEKGWNVTVIGSNLNNDNSTSGQYEGILYENIKLPVHKIPLNIADNLFYGRWMRKAMSKYKVNEQDYIFVYSMYMDLVKSVLKDYSYLDKKHISIAMVEWFQPYQYSLGRVDPRYIFWKHTFEKIVPKYAKVFPISRKLQQFYRMNGCDTLLLPIMADTNKSLFEIKRSEKNNEIIHFIYPGNATNKDSFIGIVKALASLPDEELERLRFHFTTLSREYIENFSKDGIDTSRIIKVMIFHGRLPYDDLLDLYETVDYLFLAREENIVTLSNFPSKIPELMSFGVIPVCSRVGDYAELYLQDGINSILFDGADMNACLVGIRSAINKSREEIENLRRNARICAEQKFDYHNWGDKIESFLLK